jgi:hypothetical protein
MCARCRWRGRAEDDLGMLVVINVAVTGGILLKLTHRQGNTEIRKMINPTGESSVAKISGITMDNAISFELREWTHKPIPGGLSD